MAKDSFEDRWQALVAKTDRGGGLEFRVGYHPLGKSVLDYVDRTRTDKYFPYDSPKTVGEGNNNFVVREGFVLKVEDYDPRTYMQYALPAMTYLLAEMASDRTKEVAFRLVEPKRKGHAGRMLEPCEMGSPHEVGMRAMRTADLILGWKGESGFRWKPLSQDRRRADLPMDYEALTDMYKLRLLSTSLGLAETLDLQRLFSEEKYRGEFFKTLEKKGKVVKVEPSGSASGVVYAGSREDRFMNEVHAGDDSMPEIKLFQLGDKSTLVLTGPEGGLNLVANFGREVPENNGVWMAASSKQTRQ